MNHAEAIERQAGERYLLGELSGAESEQFEAHYFSCPECTADLEAGSLLIDNARAVFTEEGAVSSYKSSVAKQGSSWSKWATALWPRPMVAATSFASVALASICLYQASVVIPQYKRAAEISSTAVALPSFQLAGHSRGEIPTISVPHNAPYFAVSFDINLQAAYPAYRCEIQDSTGAIRFSVVAPAPEVGQPITVLVPARGLQSGKIELIVNGVPATATGMVSVSRYTFTLQIK